MPAAQPAPMSRQRRSPPLLVIAVTWVAGAAAAQQCDPVLPEVSDVVSAIYAAEPSCDLNADGTVTAADITAAIGRRFPTPTPTPSLTATPTPTATSTATVTPTGTLCPLSGAELIVDVDNRTGLPDLTVNLSGERMGTECSGSSTTSYDETRTCPGDGNPCLDLTGLAPGWWRHSIRS